MTSDAPAGYYLCDYHIHTSLSFDASGTVDDVCRAAIERGLHEIGFSEHVGIDPSDEAYGTLNLDSYKQAIQTARQHYADKLLVRMGVEIDFRSVVTDLTKQYLESHEFDFVTGAVHYLDGEILLRTDIFEHRPAQEVWEDYFTETLAMVRTGLFDIVAHLDVPKRGHVPLFGPFDCTTCEEQIRAILSEIIRREAVLEINTAGLRKQANELFPSMDILKLYRQLGGELITFGSDCHSPQKVGCDFDKAIEAAEAAGFTHVATFENRKRRMVPLRLARGC